MAPRFAGVLVTPSASDKARGQSPMATLTSNAQAPAGLVQPGNLDLNARKVFNAPDGTYRTENSLSIGTDQGEVLIPTVVNGRQLSEDEAIAHFERTGENLGTFSSPDSANSYANNVHERQAIKYQPPAAKPRFAGVPVSAGPVTQDPYLADLPIPGQMTPDPVDPRHGEWNAPGAIVPVQFQQGTGAMRPAVPSIITDAISAVTAPGKAATGQYDQLEVNTDTGAVSPFDPRMVDDAQTLAGMVAPITPGAAAVKAAGTTVARQAVPEIDDLYATKDAAYAAADKLGARYSAESIDDLGSEMARRAYELNINPRRHEKAFSMLDEVVNAPSEQSLTQLDQLRQVVRRDLVDPDPRSADAFFGKEFISAIDDFIENATPAKIDSTNPQAASAAIKQARAANAVLRKSETVQEVIDNARISAAASGSGGNIDNAIRQGFGRILKSEKLRYGFSKDELAQMEKIVGLGSGKLAETLRVLAKLSPQGNGLMAALGLGATVANPMMALGPATGIIAKTVSDRATQGSVNALTKMVRTGGGQNALAAPKQGNALTAPASTTLIEQNLRNPPMVLSPTPYRVMPGA